MSESSFGEAGGILDRVVGTFFGAPELLLA